MLTVDLGPDDATLGAGRSASSAWDRTSDGLARLDAALGRLEAELGAAIPVTWFVRADAIVGRQFGSALGAFERFDPFLRGVQARGHELAWLAQGAEGMAQTHAQLVRAGYAIESARAGELSHDNASLAALDALGVAFDSSALPGRTRGGDGWRLDWAGTPAGAYHPSCDDYRVPGAPALDLLEIPLTTVPIRAPYDAAPLARYVNPAMHASVFAPAVAAVPGGDYALCVVHPDELVPRASGGHPLIAYDADTFVENLRCLARASAGRGRALSFTTVGAYGREVSRARSQDPR